MSTPKLKRFNLAYLVHGTGAAQTISFQAINPADAKLKVAKTVAFFSQTLDITMGRASLHVQVTLPNSAPYWSPISLEPQTIYEIDMEEKAIEDLDADHIEGTDYV